MITYEHSGNIQKAITRGIEVRDQQEGRDKSSFEKAKAREREKLTRFNSK